MSCGVFSLPVHQDFALPPLWLLPLLACTVAHAGAAVPSTEQASNSTHVSLLSRRLSVNSSSPIYVFLIVLLASTPSLKHLTYDTSLVPKLGCLHCATVFSQWLNMYLKDVCVTLMLQATHSMAQCCCGNEFVRKRQMFMLSVCYNCIAGCDISMQVFFNWLPVWM